MLVQERSPRPGESRAATQSQRRPRIGRPLAPAHRVLIGLIVLAAVVRFATLTQQSYWLDESQAAHEVSLSFGAMLSAWNRAEWNPPLYLLLAWPWAHVFGAGEAGLRSLSAVLGTLLIPVVYGAGSALVSRRAGLFAAAFAALNPFMIWYAQEAREYALLTLLCAGSVWCFAWAWHSGRTRALVAWGVVCALALLTQYFAGFLIIAEGGLLVWRLRDRRAVAALGAQALVVIPFIPHVRPQLGTDAGFIVSQPLWLRIEQVPATFTVNTLAQTSLVHAGIAGAVVAVALAGGLLLAVGDRRELSGAALAAALAAIVIVLPLLMALVWHDDFIARGLMPAWPPLAIAFGAACGVRAAPLVGGALAAVLLALFVWAGIRIDTNHRVPFQRPNWRGVAAALNPAVTVPRAIVVYPGQFATGPLSFYLPRTPWAGPGAPFVDPNAPVTIDELDVVANAGIDLRTPPAGTTLVTRRDVDGYEVLRYRLSAPWPTTSAIVAQRVSALVSGGGSGPTVMLQAGAR